MLKVAKLFLESLESRCPLAGDCSAFAVKGDLFIACDAADNDIVIEEVAIGSGQYRISSGSNPTTINNGPGPIIVPGIDRDMVIDAGSGIDQISIGNAKIARDLKFEGGAGSANLSVIQADIGRDVVVENAPDANFNLSFSSVAGNVDINSPGGGASHLVMMAQAHIGKSLSIDVGAVQDSTVQLITVDVGGRVTLRDDAIVSAASTGIMLNVGKDLEVQYGEKALGFFFVAQAEIGGAATLNSAADTTSVVLSFADVGKDVEIKHTGHAVFAGGIMMSSIGKDVHVESDAPSGAFSLHFLDIGGSAKLVANTVFGGGFDLLETNIGKSLTIKTGDGTNVVALNQVTVAKKTKIQTGDGDDLVQILDSIFAGDILADGGAGVDFLIELGINSYLKMQKFVNFEPLP